ncbi:hypothetical protein M3197_12155 [Sporosarcina aquimarina]|uniref:hypothetical protein n=1 Tax=Sporosarcina aquimarina TaxID=114975 RepID=UPI00203A4DA8|nr:hypothetical protein [Sporosarcina aquimarina]MCM3758216.1 hypothetical protein [Sporosarcina aquimarina]
MIFKRQYTTNEERELLVNENKDKFLVEEMNIQEGNFLVFSDTKPIYIEIEEIKLENVLLKSQNQAITERADFIEDVVAEMAAQVYQ